MAELLFSKSWITYVHLYFAHNIMFLNIVLKWIYSELLQIMTINITDPRCHPIGWASRHQDESVSVYLC